MRSASFPSTRSNFAWGNGTNSRPSGEGASMPSNRSGAKRIPPNCGSRVGRMPCSPTFALHFAARRTSFRPSVAESASAFSAETRSRMSPAAGRSFSRFAAALRYSGEPTAPKCVSADSVPTVSRRCPTVGCLPLRARYAEASPNSSPSVGGVSACGCISRRFSSISP